MLLPRRGVSKVIIFAIGIFSIGASFGLIRLLELATNTNYDYEGVYFPYTSSSYPDIVRFQPTDVKYLYQQDYHQVLINQPAVREICDQVAWRPNLFVDCYHNIMGAFNAINRQQVCIRWAMDAGAGLIHPQFWKRVGIVDLLNSSAGMNEISFLLDSEFLWKGLKENCPQLKVVKLEELENRVEINAVHIVGHQFGMGGYSNFLDTVISNFTQHSSTPIESDTPIVIKQYDSLCGWTVYNDTLRFQLAFRELFLFTPSIISLALQMLYKMPAEFIGIHLRAEVDWGRVSTGKIILDKIMARGLQSYPVAYVACGDVKELHRFMNEAGERGIKIATKWSIADEKETEQLKALEFDQLGLVDYIILNHAKYFYGVGQSSFSFALGVSRHAEQFGNLNYTGLDEDQYLMGIIDPLFEKNIGLW